MNKFRLFRPRTRKTKLPNPLAMCITALLGGFYFMVLTVDSYHPCVLNIYINHLFKNDVLVASKCAGN